MIPFFGWILELTQARAIAEHSMNTWHIVHMGPKFRTTRFIIINFDIFAIEDSSIVGFLLRRKRKENNIILIKMMSTNQLPSIYICKMGDEICVYCKRDWVFI